MPAEFDLYYIAVQHNKDQSVASLKSSYFPIPLQGEGNVFTAKAEIYPVVDGVDAQLAIRSATPPRLRKGNALVPMMQLTQPGTAEVWWVENLSWSAKQSHFISESRQTIGLWHFVVSEQECSVDVTAGNRPLSDNEFYNLLRDFQGDLFNLIVYGEGSVTQTVWSKVPIFSEEVERLIRGFIGFAKEIIKSPTHELQEVQERRLASRVRPVPRTFMELASKGDAQKLTSRAHKASFNTPENRYVAALVEKIRRVTSQTVRALIRSRDSAKQQRESIDTRLQEIKSSEDEDWIIEIDRQHKEYEQEDVERQVKEWCDLADAARTTNPVANNYEELEIKIKHPGKRYDLRNGNVRYYLDAIQGNWAIELPRRMCPDGLLLSNCRYHLELLFATRIEVKDNKETNVITVTSLKNIKLRYSPLLTKQRKLAAEIKLLNDSGWKQRMLPREIEEQRDEHELLRRRLNNLGSDEKINGHINRLKGAERDLATLKKQFKSLSIKSESQFPGSIIFVQNPIYFGVRSTFRQIMDKGQINERLMDDIEALESVGILDIPTVYEKWCLIKTVEVIRERCGFIPQNVNWLTTLVESATKKNGRYQCVFQHDKLGQRIDLAFQKHWPNQALGSTFINDNFRPDIRLNLYRFDNENWKEYAILILDAKCRDFTHNPNQKLVDFVAEIDNKYRSPLDKDAFIYVVHPAKDAVKFPRVSNRQIWGTSSFYGGSWPRDWQGLAKPENGRASHWKNTASPNHRIGAILLKPSIDTLATTDNFQRLLLMVLEYGSQEQSPLICSVCGSSNLGEPTKSTYKGNSWIIACLDCRQKAYYNNCRNPLCASEGGERTKLYKHGSYWTYHDFDPVDPYNIRCPKCGDMF